MAPSTDAQTAAPITGIDCHAHVMRRDLPLASERHSAPKRDVPVEEFIATLDAHGMSHGVLTAPSFYGTDNSLLLAALGEQVAIKKGVALKRYIDAEYEVMGKLAKSLNLSPQ